MSKKNNKNLPSGEQKGNVLTETKEKATSKWRQFGEERPTAKKIVKGVGAGLALGAAFIFGYGVGANGNTSSEGMTLIDADSQDAQSEWDQATEGMTDE